MPIICIGVGPGDKELLTVKAVKGINQADHILVPVKKEGSRESTAFSIARDYIDDHTKVEYLYFPMKKVTDDLKKIFEEHGKHINTYLDKGKNVVYLTLGDPSIYSTFTYLTQYLNEKAEYIPGVASFLQGAAMIGQPLCLGEESLAVVNMTDSEKNIRQAFCLHDNIVVMKVSAGAHLLKELMLEHKFEGSFLTNIGFENEFVSQDLHYLDEKIPYFTVAQLKKRK
jgi:precorrin-2/cobalt-factor-2 C20-methyltransferase